MPPADEGLNGLPGRAGGGAGVPGLPGRRGACRRGLPGRGPAAAAAVSDGVVEEVEVGLVGLLGAVLDAAAAAGEELLLLLLLLVVVLRGTRARTPTSPLTCIRSNLHKKVWELSCLTSGCWLMSCLGAARPRGLCSGLS